MAKDKNKKKDKKKRSNADVAAKATKRLKAMSANPLVADIIAAALVGTAAALKDTKKARQLAAHAGDELETLAKQGAERGHAMWQLALDIGRRSLESLAGTDKAPKARKAAPKAKPAPRARKAAPKAKTAPKARKSTASSAKPRARARPGK